MSLRTTTVVFCLLLATVPNRSHATSVYSMVLVGERIESGDVRSIALGGSSQLVTDSLGVLYSNPALLSRTRLVAFGATQVLSMDVGRSETYTERDNGFLFPTLRVAFPIMNLFVFSIGYVSKFDPGGSFELTETTESGVPYIQRFTRSGGLFAAPFTVAADITRFASVGLTFALQEGNVEDRWDTEFEDPGYIPGAGFQKSDLSGNNFGGGVVLRPGAGLMIGGTYETAIDYTADVSRQFTNATLDTFFTTTATLPAYATVGLTWSLGSWQVLGSYAWSDFTKMEGLSFPVSRLKPEKSYAFGVEYEGFYLGGKRLPIRLSFNYEELPFDHPEGESVSQYLVGLGTGVRSIFGRTKFDIAVQYGQTGALDTNGLEDRLFRIYVGFVAGERWSRRGTER